MAEQKKAEVHQKIKQLTTDCEQLEDLVDQLNQDAVDIKKEDEEDRKNMKEAHEEYKKEMGFKIYEIKDQIDTELKNPNIV